MPRHLLAALVLLATAAPLAAQGVSPSTLSAHGPLYVTPFVGAASPMGDSRDGLNTGYELGLALDWRPEPAGVAGLRVEGSYARMGLKGLSGSGYSGNATDSNLNLNGVLWMAPATAAAPYVTAGASYSELGVSLKGPGGSDSDSEGHFGFNLGGGVDIPMGRMSLRLDARFKQITIEGDHFQSLPITVGLRF